MGKVKRARPKAEHARKVRFRTRAPAKSKVFVAGTFNNWSASENRLRHDGKGSYATNLVLPPGRHEYKFVIDGEWQIDTENPEWIPNGLGSLNSIIAVGEEGGVASSACP
jgi:1,4-alpha-glucan branching enzyme